MVRQALERAPRVALPLDLAGARSSWARILAGISSWPGPVDFEALWMQEQLLGPYSQAPSAIPYSTTTSSASEPRTEGLSA